METVQITQSNGSSIENGTKTDKNMNESSSDDMPLPPGRVKKVYKQRHTESTSDNELREGIRRQTNLKRNQYKSTGNINEGYKNYNGDYNSNVRKIQNSISNIDLSLHGASVKKFETLQVPIVGYEVMEERARFTIYKLKVEDDKSDQSWMVFRRYTDFVRLFSRIRSEMPNVMLPLPGKRWFRDNFDPIFLEERVRALQIFVNAILSKLPNHSVVREFFCLDEPPQVLSYQPEVQAVYGALEDTILTLKMQLKQKDSTIAHLQNQVKLLEGIVRNCSNCSTNLNVNSM